MLSSAVSLADITQIAAIITVVIIWLATASNLKSPWIPASSFSQLAVIILVFLFFWNRFIAEIQFMGEPIYVWFGLVLILGVFAHWAKISRRDPGKRARL